MTISTTIRSGDGASPGQVSTIPCIIDVCSGGTVGQWYTFHPGDLVTDQIGGGRGPDLVLSALANGASVVYFTPASPTWGALPTVTKTGSGTSPTPTVALAAGASGPFDDHTIVFAIKASGAGGAGASMTVAYDGSTVVENVPVPAPGPAIMTGTVDLNGLVYPVNGLNAQTIIYSAPAAKTLTFAAAPTSAADIVAKLNALAQAAPLAVTFQLYQDNAGHAYLQTVSTAVDVSAAITITGGTALATLGLSASTASGTAATYAPPWTGQVYTFPSTTLYQTGDSFSAPCAGPTTSIQAITNAITVARANWKNTPFGAIYVTAQPANPTTAANLQTSCTSTISTYRTDNSCPVLVFTGTPFHTASATPATNAANILSTDTLVLAAFAGNTAALDCVCVDDCYVAGSANLRQGSFRRSAVYAALIKRATLSKLGADIGEGVVPGVTLRGPDLATLARDESYSTVKLGPSTGGNTGPGFAVLKSTAAGVGSPKFPAGVTRAGSASRLRFTGPCFVALQMSITGFARVQGWEGQTWPTNPATKQLLDSEASHRADDVYNDLLPYLLPEGKDPSVSKYAVAIDNSGAFLDTGSVPLNINFVPLGEVLDITMTITAQGTIVTPSP